MEVALVFAFFGLQICAATYIYGMVTTCEHGRKKIEPHDRLDFEVYFWVKRCEICTEV